VVVGVREGGGFEVLDWMAAEAESSQAYEELFTRLWRRGLEQVELVISDGAEGAASAAAVVYPAAAHQLCLAHWFRNLEGLTPRLQWWQRRKLRREFWWIFEAEQETQLRKWAGALRGAGVSGLRRWSRSFARSCHGCWPTCDFRGTGDTACVRLT
jgi:putative transposase